MITTTTSTYDSLLLHVLCEPDQDVHRLALSDFLEENCGQVERAEFIRIQIALASKEQEQRDRFNDETDWAQCSPLSASWCPNCGDCLCPNKEDSLDDPSCPLHNRASKHCCLEDIEYDMGRLKEKEKELLGGHIGSWTDGLPESLTTTECHHCREQSPDYETGVIECRQCECTGLLPDYDNVEFRRGFIASLTTTASEWRTHAGMICRVQPVQQVTLNDREPSASENGEYDWWCTGPTGRSELPMEIFRLLTGENSWGEDGTGMFRKSYKTKDSALAALCTAALLYGRIEAGILVKCGPGGCLGGGYVPTDRDDNTCDVCGGSGYLTALEKMKRQ